MAKHHFFELPFPYYASHVNPAPTTDSPRRPNYHTQTDTYKNRSAGNERHYRRLRYQQNQSY